MYYIPAGHIPAGEQNGCCQPPGDAAAVPCTWGYALKYRLEAQPMGCDVRTSRASCKPLKLYRAGAFSKPRSLYGSG